MTSQALIPEFNGTDPNYGVNSVTEDGNLYYSPGDTAYIIISSAQVLVMVPGLAFLYSGLARRKSALSMIFACLGSYCVVCIQWYLIGYSLAFSDANNGFIGNLHKAALRNTFAMPSPGSLLVPDLLFSFYQLQFAAVTMAIIMGCVAERGRLAPSFVFCFLWVTVVYCPLAHWIWGGGWAYDWGVLDFAGGGPVEIGSGLGGLAYSMVLGKRKSKLMVNFRPHNVSLITLGSVLLWFGWLGFNGGSAFGANLRAVYACWNTTITGIVSAFTWVLLDWRLSRKLSMVGWCSGLISGLVAATPASGFIPIHYSILLGFCSGIFCNYGTMIKNWIRIDDSFDLLAEHGLAGILGLFFNGLFSQEAIVGSDGINLEFGPASWVEHNWLQLGKQVAYIVACSAYVFCVSAALALAVDCIPGLHLRCSEQAELLGLDEDQLGEFAYDYVEVRRDYLAWSPQHNEAPIEGIKPEGVKLHDNDSRTRHSNEIVPGDATEGAQQVQVNNNEKK